MPSSTRPAQSPDKKLFGCTNLNIFYSSCLNICFWRSEELSKTVLVEKYKKIYYPFLLFKGGLFVFHEIYHS